MTKLIDRGSSGADGSHGLGTWLTCPRRAAFDTYAPIDDESTYLTRGNLLHTGLAHHYIRLQGRDDYLEPADAVDAYAAKHPSEYNAKWQSRVKDCLAAYVAKYGNEVGYEVVDVEKKIRIELAEGVEFTARKDLTLRRKRDHTFWIVDHKGTYAVLPKVIKSYATSLQMLGLQRIGRAQFGKNFGGVILNFVRMPAEEDNAFEFVRHEVPRYHRAVQDVGKTIEAAHKIRAFWLEQDDLDPMDVTPHFGEPCWGRFGACPYRERCTGVLYG